MTTFRKSGSETKNCKVIRKCTEIKRQAKILHDAKLKCVFIHLLVARWALTVTKNV